MVRNGYAKGPDVDVLVVVRVVFTATTPGAWIIDFPLPTDFIIIKAPLPKNSHPSLHLAAGATTFKGNRFLKCGTALTSRRAMRKPQYHRVKTISFLD